MLNIELNEKLYKVLKKFHDNDIIYADEISEHKNTIGLLSCEGVMYLCRKNDKKRGEYYFITHLGRTKLEEYERKLEELNIQRESLLKTDEANNIANESNSIARAANSRSKRSNIIAICAVIGTLGSFVVALFALLCK